MGNKANMCDITAFLARMEYLVSEGKFDFVPRRKNMQSLARHGLTIMDAKSELLTLTPYDYYKGPKQDFDTDRPGEVWEFKKNIGKKHFYIKVKIVQQNG